MSKISQIWTTIVEAFGENINVLAREMNVIQRQSKITGQALTQGLVFTFLATPQAREVEVAQGVGCAGATVTAQAVNAKLTEGTARFLKTVLERMVQMKTRRSGSTQRILDRFSMVNVHDSTSIGLPDELSHIWQGCGNCTEHAKAGIKLQVQWDLRQGTLEMLTLHDGRAQDRSAPVQTAVVQAGSLRLADLGYFDLSSFQRIGAAGAYWLTRYLPRVIVYTADKVKLDLPDWLANNCTDEVRVDMPVLLGATDMLPARMIAVRVPQWVADGRRRRLYDDAISKAQAVSPISLILADWSIFLTNAPLDLLSASEVLIVAHARWQIELLFKLWKSCGRIDASRSQKPYRILCEFYAKLIGQVIQHWLIVHVSWSVPDRSMTKVAAAIRSVARALLTALNNPSSSQGDVLIATVQMLVVPTCRINRRNVKPALFQQLDTFDA